MNGETVLRIGELSRRSGVSPELLRAWERRYGLLRPGRSEGGLRLYSAGDLERVADEVTDQVAVADDQHGSRFLKRAHELRGIAPDPLHPPAFADPRDQATGISE